MFALYSHRVYRNYHFYNSFDVLQYLKEIKIQNEKKILGRFVSCLRVLFVLRRYLASRFYYYRVFGFKPHYSKVNFFQDAWIFLTYFLHSSNVHAISFQMHYYSLVCIANICRHLTLTACSCFRALICCIPQIPQPWKGNWPSCGLIFSKKMNHQIWHLQTFFCGATWNKE